MRKFRAPLGSGLSSLILDAGWRFWWSERSTELEAWGAEKADLLGAREKDVSTRTWRQRPHYDARTTGDILLAVQGTSSRPFWKKGS